MSMVRDTPWKQMVLMILRGEVSVTAMDARGYRHSWNEFGRYYCARTRREDAIVLNPYMMGGWGGEGGVVYEIAPSVRKYWEVTRPEWSGKGGEVLIWFGVDVLGNETWKIAVREIKVGRNLIQTAIDDINVERRKGDTSAITLSDDKRSRFPPSHQVPPAVIPDWHR